MLVRSIVFDKKVRDPAQPHYWILIQVSGPGLGSNQQVKNIIEIIALVNVISGGSLSGILHPLLLQATKIEDEGRGAIKLPC